MPAITFTPIDDYALEVCLPPSKASTVLPGWYRNLAPQIEGVVPSGLGTDTTMKRCVPTLDYFSAGYAIPLWSDVFISHQACEEDCCDYNPQITWRVERPVFSTHTQGQFLGLEVPGYHLREAFKFENQYLIKTPKGYSCLFLPMPDDSPFLAISGIVDTDRYSVAINFPGLIKSGFEGVLPKGTPMVRVIPFKREDWEHRFNEPDGARYRHALEKAKTVMYDGYKHSKWTRKVWN